MRKNRSKKLTLSRETIHNLQEDSLRPVQGGIPSFDGCPSNWSCPRVSCYDCPHED